MFCKDTFRDYYSETPKHEHTVDEKLKFKCVQRSVDHKKLSNDSRMTKENKSFFGIIKNVQYMHKTEEMNCRCIERLLETTPDEI